MTLGQDATLSSMGKLEHFWFLHTWTMVSHTLLDFKANTRSLGTSKLSAGTHLQSTQHLLTSDSCANASGRQF